MDFQFLPPLVKRLAKHGELDGMGGGVAGKRLLLAGLGLDPLRLGGGSSF